MVRHRDSERIWFLDTGYAHCSPASPVERLKPGAFRLSADKRFTLAGYAIGFRWLHSVNSRII